MRRNTNGHPIVAYRAPRMTYAPDSLPRERLVALLRGLEVQTGDVLASGGDPEAVRRLRAYWSARNAFIEAGRRVRPSSNAAEMLAQVQRPLLDVLRISPDFRPGLRPSAAHGHRSGAGRPTCVEGAARGAGGDSARSQMTCSVTRNTRS